MTDMRKNNNAMRVDNHGIQWRGVCNNSFIIHLHKISGGKKIWKEMEKERKRGEKCSWLDLNSAPLCCEDIASEPLS